MLPRFAPAGVKIAIIIDDFGNSLAEAKPFLEASFPIAVSVLPKLPFSEAVSDEARVAGKTVLLHLPLEAVTNNHLLGPGAVLRNMDQTTMHQTIESDLSTVPGAQGINNHMGSKGSADPNVAEAVVLAAETHNLFLIDSLTTPDSLLYGMARKHGVPSEERDIFLDNQVNVGAIKRQLEDLAQTAKRKGKAIAIGHPHPETLQALQEMIPQFAKEGIQLVPVQELL